MVLGTRISLAQILQAAVLLCAVSCTSCQSDGPPEPPPATNAPVASVEVLPAHVSVVQGGVFVLRARVKDQWGNVLTDDRAAGVKWTTAGDVSVPATPGSSAVVTVASTPVSATASYVIASYPGVEKTDSSTIEIAVKPESDKQDWIVSDQAASSPASIALVTGESEFAEAARVNSLLAFAGEGRIDPLKCVTTAHCGIVTIFSPGRGVAQSPVDWASGCDVVNFGATAGLPTSCHPSQPPVVKPLPPQWTVPVTVYTLANKPNIDAQVSADKAYADWAFDQPLLGIKLDIRVNSFAGAHTSVTHGLACKTNENHELTSDLAAPPFQVGFDAKHITVVYVDAINPGTGDEIGFTCPYAAGVGTLIIVSADAINNSTLAHELGHALGQWHSAERDHPDVPLPRLAGFDPSNLMWSSESDWGTSIRRNLTLGQVFQMNLADFSFLKKSLISPAAGLACSTDAGSNSPCPLLARDQR